MATTISPYTTSELLEEPTGERILDVYNQEDLYNQVAPKVHIVKEGETFQSIAYQYYRDSGYWYRIVAYNKIINPFSLKPYTRLFIPQ